MSSTTSSSKRERRVPQCARCRSHNTFATVRGHKRQCQWKDCTCAKCMLVAEKRRVTAVRVAILRRERKRRISHRMGLDAFHFGLQPAGTWGMMSPIVGGYTANQFYESRRMAIGGEPYYNEMLHMKYRGMCHYGSEYQIYPGERLPCRDEEANNADSGISQNLESFQHEYKSFMGKVNESNVESGEVSPGNQIELTTSRHSSPGPHTAQRVCIASRSPQLYINGSPIPHDDFYQPRLPHERHRYLSMMLNTPLTLPCPCPVKQGRELPYGVCM